MKITVQARLKNGVLWQAIEKAGGQSALAGILGVTAAQLGGWVNFTNIPKRLDTPKMIEVEAKLVRYAGITLDEVFPPELQLARNSKGKLDVQTRVIVTAEIPISQLLTGQTSKLLETSFEETEIDSLDAERLHEQIERALESNFTPREINIVKAHFGIDREQQSLESIANDYGLTTERIRQIEAKVLGRLRHPKRSRHLKAFVTGEHDVQLERITEDTHLYRRVHLPEGAAILRTMLTEGWTVVVEQRRAATSLEET